ncbi:MAG TPA: glycosyltransferase, partial [Verrucomicrobiales bacterium]|nr:glycosyltransferase [Verrucomicrobiales bacterium]
EHVLEALPEIARKHPEVVYLILGATHPHLVAREGESYRLGLERMAENLGVTAHVIFYNRFVSQDDLKEFIGATDIYLTPYLNEQQITSGTLAYVYGAGKPVVSTPYWHARELLADGRGVLVPFRDHVSIAGEVCALLEDPGRMEQIRQAARQGGREMIWPAVAQRYLESFQHARAGQKPAPRTTFADWTLASRPYDLPPVRLDHIERMTDSTGIFQHATFNVPNFHEGYCTDDNARAFILCNLLEDTGCWPRAQNLERLASSYLAFLTAALNHSAGRFRNFMSHGRAWLEHEGSEDSHARALWAVGTGAGRARNTGHARLCASLFEKGLTAVDSFRSPRAWTFTILGIHEYLRRYPGNERVKAAYESLALRLLQRWEDSADEDWPWFEQSVTYDNARICQALILFGEWMPHSGARETGLKSLRWLAGIQKSETGHFRPVGSNGFLQRNGARAQFDQQPVEAQAMISACLDAYRATEDGEWLREARCAFEWFLGRNDLGKSLYDFSSGGCCDGLHHDRINENQGAESTLAFHLSLVEMNFAEHPLAAGVIPRP